jgi:hypothetical protein
VTAPDIDTDHDLDADSSHDEPTGAVTLVEYELRELRRNQRALIRLQERAADREEGRDEREAARDAVLERLTAAVERLASDPGVIRVVVERGSGLLERALVPDVLAGLAKLLVAGAFLAAALTGLQVSGFGVTISAIAEQALRDDTDTEPPAP